MRSSHCGVCRCRISDEKGYTIDIEGNPFCMACVNGEEFGHEEDGVLEVDSFEEDNY